MWKIISPAKKKKAAAACCLLCEGTMNEDDYSDKYMRGAPCKHYICEAHANNIYGGENADWRSAAQARLATVLAATDGAAGDAAEG